VTVTDDTALPEAPLLLSDGVLYALGGLGVALVTVLALVFLYSLLVVQQILLGFLVCVLLLGTYLLCVFGVMLLRWYVRRTQTLEEADDEGRDTPDTAD
jgi:hypothetical protein